MVRLVRQFGAGLALLTSMSGPAVSQQPRGAHEIPQLVDKGAQYAFVRKYLDKVQEILAEAYSPDVILRVLVTDSSASETVVGLRRKGGVFEIFRVTPMFQIWWFEHPHMDLRSTFKAFYPDMPDNAVDIPLSRCAVRIDEDTAQKISKIWKGMLDGATREVPAPGLDGTSYYFSMPRSTVIGEAWSPVGDTPVAKLVTLVVSMRGYCNEPSYASRQAIRDAITAML